MFIQSKNDTIILQSFGSHGKWWWFLHGLEGICFVTRVKESRDGRVDSWRSFQAQGKKSKEKKNRSFLKPPKVKMEQRDWCSAVGLFTSPSLHTLCVSSFDCLLAVVLSSHSHQDILTCHKLLILANLVFYCFFFLVFSIHLWSVHWLLEEKQICTRSEMCDFFFLFFPFYYKIKSGVNQPEPL